MARASSPVLAVLSGVIKSIYLKSSSYNDIVLGHLYSNRVASCSECDEEHDTVHNVPVRGDSGARRVAGSSVLGKCSTFAHRSRHNAVQVDRLGESDKFRMISA
ncbi:hypothetical protein CBL_11283 [Carabus blaptoides fortunei]